MTSTEELTVESTGGIRLAGVLHHPGTRTRNLAVIVAHGMLSDKSSEKHRAICERLAAAGFPALRFDFRGRGDSGGDPNLLTVSNQVEDLRAVISLLRRSGHQSVALVGSSLGGTVAILTAAADPGIAGLVSIASPARLPEQPRAAWGGSGNARDDGLIEVAPGELIHESFFADARKHEPVAAARRIACPWLIIHGDVDEVVPPASGLQFAAEAPAAEIDLRPTADHRFSDESDRRWLIDRVVQWIDRLH